MTQPPPDNPSRRAVITAALRAVSRAAALASLGLLTAGLIRKQRRLTRQGPCTNRGVCSNCAAYRDCPLPQALSRKQTLARENHD